MAASSQEPNQISINIRKETHHQQPNHDDMVVEVANNYSQRGQWLRAAVLGANDGLVTTASLIMGVGAVRKDIKTMFIAAIAGLVAGACSMAIGEFVSVYSQYDIEMAQLKRENLPGKEFERRKKSLPSPIKAAAASAFTFAIGGLLGAAFIKDYAVRVGVVIGLSSFALLGFGWLGAVLGHTRVVKSSLRVLLGGWFAMAITYGLTKAIGSAEV